MLWRRIIILVVVLFLPQIPQIGGRISDVAFKVGDVVAIGGSNLSFGEASVNYRDGMIEFYKVGFTKIVLKCVRIWKRRRRYYKKSVFL